MPDVVLAPPTPAVPPPAAPVAAAPPPPPAPAAPRVNDDDKKRREWALTQQRKEQEWNAKVESDRAALTERERKLEDARKIGAKDLIGMFRAAGVPEAEIPTKLNEAQLEYMRSGTVPEAADAPILKMQQRLDKMEADRVASEQRRQQEEYQRAEAAEQEENEIYYRDLNRRVATSTVCDVLKVPIATLLLDQKLRKYMEETKLDPSPVFDDLARETETEIDKALNGRNRYLIKDGKQMDADGKVIGYVSATPPPVAAAPGATPAAPAAPAPSTAFGSGPGPKLPPASVPEPKERLPTMDPRDAMPSTGARFGRKIVPPQMANAKRYEELLAAKEAAPAAT